MWRINIIPTINTREISFFEAIYPVIRFSQFFGVMPMINVNAENPKSIKFSWHIWHLLRPTTFLFWNMVVSTLFLRFLLKIGITAKNIVSLVFFTMSQMGYLLFLLLAREWPSIMDQWLNAEKKFLHGPYVVDKTHLGRNIKCTAVTIGLLSLGEHAMYQASTIYSFYVKLVECHIITEDRVKLYYTEQYPHIFDVLPYHHIFAVMLQILSFTSTFVWNFMDLFIILISIGLTTRFRQLYKRLHTVFDLKNTVHILDKLIEEIRFDYIILVELLSFVDKRISSIILLSCLNNVYFICYQLMLIFNVLRYPINYSYFWLSMIYLIARTAYLFLAAASINDASKMPLNLLRKIPSMAWCEEHGIIQMDRFVSQINTETVALSAMGFFHFTRKIFFQMLGTIITYELVALQFDINSGSKTLPPLCS